MKEEIAMARPKKAPITQETAPQAMEARKLDLAWLAGFIDGEGSIGIYREFDKRKGENYHVYRGALSIVNTNRDSLERCQEIIGAGRIVPHRSHKAQRPTHKLAYHWALRKQELLWDILLELTPYLVIKKMQALLVADYCDSRMATPPTRGWYRPYTEEQLENYQLTKIFNKRGV